MGLSILRGPELIVEIANESILEIWGKSWEQVINKPIFKALPEARSLEYENLLRSILYQGERVVFDESPLTLMRSGKCEDLYFKFVYEPLREAAGAVSGIMILADEITDSVNIGKRITNSTKSDKIELDNAEFGAFDWNILKPAFQYSNKLAYLFGYLNPEGLTQESFSTRIHPDDHYQRNHDLEQAYETGIWFCQSRVVWPDNSIHWIRENGRVIYDIYGKPARLNGIAIDISNEKDVEASLQRLVDERTLKLLERNEELKRSEERYHKMVEEVQDCAIILLDKNGIIQNWNKGAEKIKQYTQSEAIGKSFKMFYLPLDRENKLPEKLIQQAIFTGKAIHEGWRLRKDQTRFWGSISLTVLHNEKNEIIGFSKVTRDLTERKIADDKLHDFSLELEQRNEALRKSEERYFKMIEEVQGYAIILLNENGDIENWNIGAEKLNGYSAKQIIGKNFRTFYTQGDRDKNLPEMLLDKARTKGSAVHEGWRLRKDGSSFWGSIVLTALRGIDGNLIGFSKVTRDLTEIKNTEEKMREYTLELTKITLELREALHKEKELNEIKTKFVTMASHEFRTPLTTILSSSMLISKYNQTQDQSKRDKHSLYIRNSVLHLNNLLEDFLNLGKLEEGHISRKIEIFDFKAYLKQISREMKMLLKPGQQLKFIFTGKNHLASDKLLIKKVLINLISNAIKFSGENKLITITAINSDLELKMQVKDNGIGIPLEDIPQLFSTFFRAKNAVNISGVGIGLHIVKKYLEILGGSITLSTQLDKGTSFDIILPSKI